MPRMDKVDMICRYFNITRSDLLEIRRPNDDQDGYYINQETAKVAQEMRDNKELKILFDAARTASPEDLRTTYNMLMALKRKERGNDDEPC